MGIPRFSNTALLLLMVLLLFVSSNVQGHGNAYGQGGRLNPSDCNPRCQYRCSATSHKKPCMFYCDKCCAECLCVPPGTYGNREACPCYNSWKTKEGGPKCP